MFRASVSRNPDGDLIRYFGGRITGRELDELTDAFAVALLDLGISKGDRVALYLQNVPQFVIGMLATWKAGAIAVPVNPMNRARELDAILRDSGARVLVCLQGLYRDVAAAVVGVPDAYRGETVKAYVSLRPGKTATAEELIGFCREQMAAYKYPRQIEFLDELPKTVSGKLLRRELRARG